MDRTLGEVVDLYIGMKEAGIEFPRNEGGIDLDSLAATKECLKYLKERGRDALIEYREDKKVEYIGDDAHKLGLYKRFNEMRIRICELTEQELAEQDLKAAHLMDDIFSAYAGTIEERDTVKRILDRRYIREPETIPDDELNRAISDFVGIGEQLFQIPCREYDSNLLEIIEERLV